MSYQPQPQPQPQPHVPVKPADPSAAPGAWQYPYVDESQLAPVGPSASQPLPSIPDAVYAAPTRAARDPRRNTLATVIVFIALLFGLWAILGFLSSLSATLASINSGSDKLERQLKVANVGLAKLEVKTGELPGMRRDAKQLRMSLEGIDGEMTSMLAGVNSISSEMQQMDASLASIDSQLAEVNDLNAQMATQLGEINTGLESQQQQVAAMSKDVAATSQIIGALPPMLAATNGRLAHVNRVVNYMGCRGITNTLDVKIKLGPIPNGNAQVFATVVPPGAWGANC
jgi:uncharacterized protein YoxC